MFNLNKSFLIFFAIILCFSALPISASEIDGTITGGNGYIWGENLGWINFNCDNCDVHITDTALTGYAWSHQHGWINLSPDVSGVTNNCDGELGGKAWSRSLGWVDFSGIIIDADGNFTGVGGTPGSKAGRLYPECDNCGVSTDWLQCDLRASPAQVVINSITDTTVSSISANITIENEGLIDTEYQYEWCVVSDIGNSCGGGDDVYYSSAAKLITAGQSWTTEKSATVNTVGTYYFKLVVYYGANYSVASSIFSAVNESLGGGGGGGSVANPLLFTGSCNGADLNKDRIVNSVDFSILLYFWKTNYPFKNPCVDINQDKKTDSVDFSIMLFNWGKKL